MARARTRGSPVPSSLPPCAADHPHLFAGQLLANWAVVVGGSGMARVRAVKYTHMPTDTNPKLRVLLLQLPVPNNPALNVPLALGYLKAYAYAAGLQSRVEIELLPRALADHAGNALLVDEIVALAPEVLGLSLYTWNSERSLAIAGRVKAHLPQLQVVVGGPEAQRDNGWVLEHPAVDVAVIGEGEQTFADLLRVWSSGGLNIGAEALAAVSGIAYRQGGVVHFTTDRSALSDLAVVPSPYLQGYLEAPADSMMMIEVSRWCPYGCSFCLYGRNMGPKLGSRYFGLERVVDEIRWARERGITKVHFIEANLNLVPLFWPLMRELAALNADHRMTFYAELRGEHLTDEVVAALHRANVRYVEVGLQTANPAALRASHRRTDLGKWAAGTRRLYRYGIEVYLDVILGLPEDTAAGVQTTLDFLQREALGPYDVFTLQVLPGTAVRQQAEQYGLRYQSRPPYYVLETNQFSYDQLLRLRRELKVGADLDPDAVEGMPMPRTTALLRPTQTCERGLVSQLWLTGSSVAERLAQAAGRLATQVDLVLAASQLVEANAALATCIACNPSSIIDLYLLCDAEPPTPDELRAWREALPYQPGYLDRVAVYGGAGVERQDQRVSPRCFLVLPWTSAADPAAYGGIAEVIWRFELAPGEAVPAGAWRAAGGAGVWLHLDPNCVDDERAMLWAQVQGWAQDTGRLVWPAAEHPGSVLESESADLTVYAGRI